MKGEKSKKVAFVVTSQGHDFFSAMTRVSVASLRAINPESHVIILCDWQSDEAMQQACDPLIDDVDEWLAVDTPPGDAGFRNRHVKTRLRSLLDGPFLFLDSDTFVRGDLSEIFDLDCDLGGARNHSRKIFTQQVWKQDWATLKEMGWAIDDEVYINGGVLFFNDTEGARTLADEWHRRWLQSANRKDYHRDQPALNSALHAVRPKLSVLPDYFNAQILTAPKAATDAKIWHYYSSAGQKAMTSFDVLVGKVLLGAKIDRKEINKMIDSRHPWRRENLVDAWAAQGLMRRDSCAGWEAAWLQREMRTYIGKKVSNMLSKAKRSV